jgi:hypothetical protein
MSSGQHDRETIHYLDSQRQVTHNQILEALPGSIEPTRCSGVRTAKSQPLKGNTGMAEQQEREWVRNHRMAGFVADRFAGEYAGE